MKIILVAESGDDWLGHFDGVETVDPRDYLSSPDPKPRGRTRVYNLSRSYAYQSMGYYVSLLAEARGELITRSDSGRLLEFDALFIRETTAVNHHTYRIARRAEAAGMIVIDDPVSILRCTNKVYLAELLTRAKVPTPQTTIAHRRNADKLAGTLSYPCVLKRPESAFSQGVVKAANADEFKARLAEFFEDSELVIAQQYMRTDFDWRVGVMDGRAMFACKDHLARGHLQIAKHDSTATSKPKFGKCETFPVETAPRKAVATAVKAAGLIGNGLYGVDVKEVGGQFFVIEVNDNPNLNSSVEDAVLRDERYRRIMESFAKRIEATKQS